MAKMEIHGWDTLQLQLNKMEKMVEKNGQAAVNAGGELAKKYLQEAVPVSSRNHEHLRDHIVVRPGAYSSDVGFHCDVLPDGKRADGERFAKIAFVLEYGHSKTPAKPWMRTPIENNREAILAAMKEVLFRQ